MAGKFFKNRLNPWQADLIMTMTFPTLRVSLCTLLVACSCGLYGCGSDNSSGVSANRKNQQPPVKQEARIAELVVNLSEKGGSVKSDSPRKLENSDQIVLPPEFNGGCPTTLKEIEASMRAVKEVDPERVQIFPPGVPGVTLAEARAALKKQEQERESPDWQNREAFPPQVLGGQVVTVGELKAARDKGAPLPPEPLQPQFPPNTAGRSQTTLGNK